MHSKIKLTWPSAVKTTCESPGCRLHVDLGRNGKTLTILDVDEYSDLISHTGSRCDFLIFLTINKMIAAAVELKSGSFKSSQVLNQLQAGAQQINELSKHCKSKVEGFCPILLHGRVRHASDLKTLRQKKVSFKGTRYSVIRAKCGSKLSNILDKGPQKKEQADVTS